MNTGDWVFSVTSQEFFTVARKTKVKGLIYLWDERGGRYPITDCMTKDSATSLKIVLNLPIGAMFCRVGDSCPYILVDRFKSRKTGVVTLVDRDGVRHNAADCLTFAEAMQRSGASITADCPEVSDTSTDCDELLDASSLATVLEQVEGMIRSGVYELDLLEALEPHQKRQVWDALSLEQREILKQVRGGVAA